MHPWPFLVEIDSSLEWGCCSSEKNDLRQDETIAIDPVWVLGVEIHELVEHDMGNGCHAHGSSGMTGIGFGGGIDLGEEQLISMDPLVYGLYIL